MNIAVSVVTEYDIQAAGLPSYYWWPFTQTAESLNPSFWLQLLRQILMPNC